ncbi:Vacuolar ATP synthase subunit D [Spraguea lophii 42_110]|uniref:Vacuolar ATP synthase subunit D n=1 Tax=Spraguea lophii (strain 42_110) TaxID=1358809 RepID=S7W8U5_SPRLO|nr:Vacuolar ATP synthase subunit D [Spraguea lophii 42_110]
MGDNQKFNVFPTRMNLNLTKQRLYAAEKGYTLLIRKGDALMQKHREIAAQLAKEKEGIADYISKAYFSLTEAEFLGANLKKFAAECRNFPIKINASVEQLSGIKMPTFKLVDNNTKQPLSLDRSGVILQRCRNMFNEVLRRLLVISSLENSFLLVEEIMKMTNRRVNALNCFLIPKLNNTVTYINSELDEADREDFFRLKKVQGMNKKKD